VKKIYVSVSLMEYDEFSRIAKEQGFTLQEWARRRLRGDLPPPPSVMEEAFRQLDVSDRMRELSPKPVPPPAVPPEQKLVQIGERLPTDHSCLHHAHVRRDDGGPPLVCMSRAQFGRPCYFASAGAVDCTMFTPRRR
jgi:hypothetical protein